MGNKALTDIVTFTRASSGTYFDSTGALQVAGPGQPRYDYNPSTNAFRGVLIEEARTNLVLNSNQLDSWNTNGSTVTTNSVLAPDGNITADKVVASATTGRHIAWFSASTSTSTAYTYTIFAKAAEYNFLAMSLLYSGNSAGIGYTFNLTDGSITQLVANGAYSNISAEAVYVGNGWWRCRITWTNGSTNPANYFTVAPSNAANPSYDASYDTVSYTGDGTSGIYAWGAQLEAGSFPTSYIPTSTTSVTRAVDLMTAFAVTNSINQTEATIYAEVMRSTYTGSGKYPSILELGDGTSQDRILLYSFLSGGNDRYVSEIYDNTTSQTAVGSASALTEVAPNTVAKIAFAYALNDQAISVNGCAAITDSSVTLPTGLVNMYIGNTYNANQAWSGCWIRKIKYYPKRLTNAELQALTS